jgi:hypothetical protein
VARAIVDELRRQAEGESKGLTVAESGEGRLRVEGSLDLEALAMAVVGAVAGGP